MESPEIKEVKAAVQSFMTDLGEFRTTFEKNQKEKDGLNEEKMTKMGADLAAQHEAMTLLQTKLNRVIVQSDEDPDVEKKDRKHSVEFSRTMLALSPSRRDEISLEDFKSYKAGFNAMLRGKYRDPAMEAKALSLGSDPDGGYWMAPPEISNRITTRVFETTPMRSLATVQPISTHEYKIPQDPNSGVSGGWVGETAARPNTATPQLAMKSITAYEQYAQPVVSQTLLEDSMIDVETWLGNKTADIISRTENTAFISGSGAAQPRGILTYPAGSLAGNVNKWGQIQQVGSGSSGAFTYTGLINLLVSLKDKYHVKAQFLIKRVSIAAIMLLQDGNGRYIFQPIVGGNFNNTPLLGYNVNYANDMPVAAGGSLSLAFGDFGAGYVIVDRVGIGVIRDALTAKPNVLFYTRKRTGGDVDDFDAIKLQVLT